MRERFYKASSPLKVYRGIYERTLRLASVLALLAALLSINTGCAGFRSCDASEPWLGPDKAKHFAAAALIGGGVTALAANEMDTGEAAAIGWASAVGAGLVKEHYDLRSKKTCFSWKDLAWDIVGASAGVSIAAWAKE